jgi:hypothetical protein
MKIKALLATALLIFVAQISIQGQKKTPPPKSATSKTTIYATDYVDADGWTKYVSAEGGFNVLLPSEPERTTKVIPSRLGQKTLVTYSASFKKIAYVVGFLDFKMPVNDEKVLQDIYDKWQEGVTGLYPNGELEQKVTDYQGKPARELVYTVGLITIRAKAFYTKGKLIQMLAMNVIEGDDALLRELAAGNNKFFESVKLDSPSTDKNNSLTGAINDRLYQNNFFNFTLDLPADWILATQEDTDLLKEGAKEKMKQDKKPGDQTSFKRTAFLFSLTKNAIGSMDNASIIAAAEVGPPVKATLQQVAAATVLNFVAKSGYQLEAPTKYVKIGGRTFAVIQIKKELIPGVTLHQKFYMTPSRGYFIEFVGSFTKPADSTVFDEMVKSLKFTTSK